MHIDTRALADGIRLTLAAHLREHLDDDEIDVTVDGDRQHCIFVEVNGYEFTLTLGDAQRNPLLDAG